MTEYQGLSGYSPSWLDYEQSGLEVRKALTPLVGHQLSDIKGVVSQRGWEPDWPLVFQFDVAAVSFATHSDYLWAIDRWLDFPLIDSPADAELVLSFESVTERLDLTDFRGATLQGVNWPMDRSYGQTQAFYLDFGRLELRIFDAGDEIGVEKVTSEDRVSSESLVRGLDV